MFAAFLTFLAFLFSALLPSSITLDLQQYGMMGLTLFAGFGIVGNAILGSWVGWGVAHWRFPTRPVGVWPYWVWPAVTGAILYGGAMFVLMLSLGNAGVEAISSSEKAFAVVFATAVGPLFGMIGATFFRYVLYATALGSGRETGVAN